MKLDPADPLNAQLADVVFVVDASNFEQHCLWREFNRAVHWQSDPSGTMLTVGHVNDMPVNIALNWARINGQKVMFVDTVSQVVDHRMVDAWLEANCAPRWDKGHRTARTNGMNFAHCLHAISDVTGIALKGDECTTLVSVDTDLETAKASDTFGALVAERPSIVYQDSGWTLRTAFIAGWLAGLRRRVMRG